MIAVQVAAGLDEPTAGPSYSVPNLAQALASEGVQAPLHCVLGWRGAPRPDLEPRPQRHRQDAARAPFLNALCLSGDLHRALRAAAPTADLFHAHGLWLMPDIYPAWVARAAGKPFVLSPRGMLGGAALAFSSLRKQLVWRLLQGPAARGAACLHATSLQELAEIRAFGLTGPVAVIPNGVEVRASPRPLPTGPGPSSPLVASIRSRGCPISSRPGEPSRIAFRIGDCGLSDPTRMATRGNLRA